MAVATLAVAETPVEMRVVVVMAEATLVAVSTAAVMRAWAVTPEAMLALKLLRVLTPVSRVRAMRRLHPRLRRCAKMAVL